ncbi:hypothetical protein ES702_04356 [subsurface metagenome]
MNAKSEQGISESLTISATIVGTVCIGVGILMTYQGKMMPIANVSIPAGLIFLIAGLILFGVALSRPTRQEEHWWKSKWIWVVAIIILGAVVFGIIQPFVWTWVYKQYPPSATVTLSTLLTIVLALLALGVSAFGVGVYLLLKQRIIRIAHREAEKKSGEAQREVTHKLVLQFLKGHARIAYQKWKEREILKKNKSQNPQEKDLEGLYLKDAIDFSRDVLRFAESTLPIDKNKKFWQDPNNREYLMWLKNNLAYYLAEGGEMRDAEDARKYAKEVEREARSQIVPNYDYLDTVAWVLKQFPLSEEDKEKSKSIVAELEQRPDIKKDDKEKLLRKYKKDPQSP